MNWDISHPLLAQAYDESNAETFDEVIERALYLYVVVDNPEEALEAERYYEESDEVTRGGGSEGDGR